MSFKAEHFKSAEGTPAGGLAYGSGFAVAWRNDHLEQTPGYTGVRGATPDDVIAAVIDRLELIQNTELKTEPNQYALYHLKKAQKLLSENQAKAKTPGAL